MTLSIGNNVNFIDTGGSVKNLATEMAKIGTGGGGGSTVADSTTNGNILVNGSEVNVYDDTTIKGQIGTLANLKTPNKVDLVQSINSGFSQLNVVTVDPATPAIGQIWFRSDL
jgi:hypothetical protein